MAEWQAFLRDSVEHKDLNGAVGRVENLYICQNVYRILAPR